MWVLDQENNRMVNKEITYVPGLYKIFDEILVNAADNKVRDKKMDTIKIDINAEKGEIKIFNNGKGIPVVHHKEEKMYVPTMIFGHLLTSSNFNDEEEKVTGGRNGYGAKLCNVFSKKFTVEDPLASRPKTGVSSRLGPRTWVRLEIPSSKTLGARSSPGSPSSPTSRSLTWMAWMPTLSPCYRGVLLTWLLPPKGSRSS